MGPGNHQLPSEPISAVGIISSLSHVPSGYDVVAQTTDGADADLWKDALFKSKVTRYLCFSRNPGPEVVVDLKVTEVKQPLPQGFTAVNLTLDTKETAMRKKRLCVKTSPGAAAETAVYDIQVQVSRSRTQPPSPDYCFVGEINNLGVWCRVGDAPRRRRSQETAVTVSTDVAGPRVGARPDHERQNSGSFTPTVLTDVPFDLSGKFSVTSEQTQPVNLTDIRIKSLEEIEEEFQYNFSTERSIAL